MNKESNMNQSKCPNQLMMIIMRKKKNLLKYQLLRVSIFSLTYYLGDRTSVKKQVDEDDEEDGYTAKACAYKISASFDGPTGKA